MEETRIPVWLYWAVWLLLGPALLINLGLMTFIDDEGIRSLVALEMDLSGNLVTPTMHGEYYYKKPPLFNWLLLGWFSLTGKISEFTARIPTVLALMGYCLTIYSFLRKHYDRDFSFLGALFFLTCGRVLFWDSMLALIDMTFSWVIYSSLMLTYHLFEKGQYRRLFILTYFLTAVGFLLKGLPAIVFQGITLFTWLAYKRQLRLLFSIGHVLGGAVFLLLVGGYYLLYHQYNDLGKVFSTLFTESSQRTAVHYGIWETLVHLVTFPLEMVYHFLPWSLLVLVLWHRRVRSWILADPFITYQAIIFLANIVVYWISPEVYPRYLLMLAPLIFTVFGYLFEKHQRENTWIFRGITIVFGLLMAGIALAWWLPPFFDRLDIVAYRWLKAWSVAAALSVLAVAYWRGSMGKLVLLAVFLLVFRIGFNFFVLPDRNAHDYGDQVRKTTQAVGAAYADVPLYIYGDSTVMQPTNSFYLTHARRAIVPIVEEPQNQDSALYLLYPRAYPDLAYQILDSLSARHRKATYYVVTLSERIPDRDSLK